METAKELIFWLAVCIAVSGIIVVYIRIQDNKE